MRTRLAAAMLAPLLGLGGIPAAAASPEPAATTIERMRARDRFAAPRQELDAWQAFARAVAADPAAPPALRAEVHGRLAIAYFYAGAHAEGWAEIEKGERIVAGAGPDRAAFLPELLAYGSLLSTELGDLDRAAAYGGNALAAATALAGDDSAEAALAYNSLAYVDFARGDMAPARERMCAAAERARRHLPPSDPMVANNLISCAIARYYLDDPEAAEAIRDASAFARAHLPADHPKLTLALNSSSGILTALGHYAEAETVIRREIELIRAHYGDDHADLYSSLSLLGRVLGAQGKLDEAEAVLRGAMDLAARTPQGSDPAVRGQSILNLAQLEARRGDLDAALALQRRGYERLKADLVPGHIDIGGAEIGLAGLLLRKGETAEALRLAQSGRALLAAGLAEGHKDRLSGDIAYAEALAFDGKAREALAIAAPAAEALERRLIDLATSRSELVSLSPVMVAGFGRLARIALLAGDAPTAIRAAQLASLSDLNIVNAELAARRAADALGAASLVERLRREKAEAARLRRGLARAEAANAAEAADISRRLDAAEAEAARLVAEIEERLPRYRELARPRPASLEAIRSRLGPREAFVLPLAFPGGSLTILVGRDEIVHGVQTAGSLEPLVARIARSIDAFALAADPAKASFDSEAAHLLYRSLFPEAVERRLSAYDTLLFPASGPVASLSPALLLRRPAGPGASLAGAHWLIRSHAVAVVSDFADLAAPPAAAPAGGFVGIGDPALGPPSSAAFTYAGLFRGGAVDAAALRSLPSLAGARGELMRIDAALGAKETLLLTGADASEARVKALDFRSYRVAAFATHGLTSGEINGIDEPALVLTPPAAAGEGEDGLLTASEIATLDIPADWVILSACNSGAGRAAGAPAYSGLARAFRLAGARSLLLSHWRVRDDAASRLSADTVRGAAGGLSRAEALRRAMLALIDDPAVPGAAHPALWAPFILIGD